MLRLRSMTLVTILLLLSPLAMAQQPAKEYVEGVHYNKVANVSPPRRDGKIEVVEVFSYMCPHCNTFQPYVKSWSNRMPENVVFSRIPVIFQRSWQPLAVAYYTAEMMGVLDQSHMATFNAIHRERKQFRSMEDLAKFYSQFGISADQFLSTSKSFAVDTRLRKGAQMTGASGWGVQSTPTLVVAGKYLVNASRAVPQSELMNVVDFLVAKETTLLPTAEQTAKAADAE